MSWCFAKVNHKLAEIYFEGKPGKPKILGHCFVKKSEYKTKKELKWIDEDTKKFQLIYKNGKYTQKRKLTG
ncbi:hypothetical protein L6272_03800 [Microgenomates group bacterium]|nr:hypothetical protein [Microgenomates group bacterium]